MRDLGLAERLVVASRAAEGARRIRRAALRDIDVGTAGLRSAWKLFLRRRPATAERTAEEPVDEHDMVAATA